MTKRVSRIAALEAAQKTEIERGNETPRGDAYELGTDLEDEFIGGFQPSKSVDEPTDDVWRRVGKGRFFRRVEPSPWGRVWGRVDLWAERFGRPVLLQHIPRRWAAERPTNGPYPFVLQAARQAEQRLPEVTPEETDPNGAPSEDFARGILRAEKETLIRRANEARIQRFLCRTFKPSRVLEEKRFPKLGKVSTRLVPRVAGAAKVVLRAELERLVALFDGAVQMCPPETTTKMLTKRPVGRPRKHADNAAKQKAYREAKRETLAANGAVLLIVRRKVLLSTTALTKPYLRTRDVPLSTLSLRPGLVPPTLAPAAHFQRL